MGARRADQAGAVDRLRRTRVTAEAERLVGHGSRAFLSGMGRGKERHPFQHRGAFVRSGTRVDQRVEVLERQRKGADDAELVARDTLYGPQDCQRRRNRDDKEPLPSFGYPLH